jgi:hypothetical protein
MAAREAYSGTLSVRPRAPTKQMGLFQRLVMESGRTVCPVRPDS